MSFTCPSPTATAAQLLVVPRSIPMMVARESIGGPPRLLRVTPPVEGPLRAWARARRPGRPYHGAMPSTPDAGRWLFQVGSAVRGAYAEQRSLLSFEEYLEVFLAAPRLQARNSAQLLRDVVDHFGWR